MNLVNPEIKGYPRPHSVECSFTLSVGCENDREAAAVRDRFREIWDGLNNDVTATILGGVSKTNDPARTWG
jgi:hypothetical protein